MSLVFYYGSMNSGKSSHLLQSNYNYIERGLKTRLFLPSVIGKTRIISRIGLCAPALIFDSFFIFKESDFQGISALFIDEAQFLTKQQVFQLLQIKSLAIYCYGLRSDFHLDPFEGSLYLLLIADGLREMKSVCDCGKKSTLNKRLSEGQDQIDIQGNYQSFCRECFFGKN